jgi:hypothetical protein
MFKVLPIINSLGDSIEILHHTSTTISDSCVARSV